MASGINPITSPVTTPNPSASSTAANNLSTPDESTFLNLLVAQMKNQDPLNPTDSTQFVSQLAQFSELEQMINIRKDADQLVTSTASSPTSNSTTNPATPTA
jgi:flagellar basal-body rod modification protein FlgD